MELLKKIALGVLALVLILIIISYFLPSSWRAAASIDIDADRDKIYQQIARLRNWPKWAVWYQETDPEAKLWYEGPQMGQGAHSFWDGEKMGKGNLLITKADPDYGVEYDLYFDDSDMKAEGKITLDEQGEKIRVKWIDGGELGTNPFMRYMGFYISRMVGRDFAKSLKNLKRLLEGDK